MSRSENDYGNWQTSASAGVTGGLHYLLLREGFMINHKRTERLYREENLMLRVRRRKKMAAESRVAPPTPERKNHC